MKIQKIGGPPLASPQRGTGVPRVLTGTHQCANPKVLAERQPKQNKPQDKRQDGVSSVLLSPGEYEIRTLEKWTKDWIEPFVDRV